MMRAIVLLLVFTMALAVRAADNSDDDDDAKIAPGGHPARLKGIDEDVQRQAVDPDEEPEAEPEVTDPFADDPDADDDILPEDRPSTDPDVDPVRPVDPASPVDPAGAMHDVPSKKRSIYGRVLESPLKDSPLKESPLHSDDAPAGAAKDDDE
jgi:hypothetical protein